jgi:hypothetical protein
VLLALPRNTPSTLRKREVTLAHLATIAPEELAKKSCAPLVLLVSKTKEKLLLTAHHALSVQPKTYPDKQLVLNVVVVLKLIKKRLSASVREDSVLGNPLPTLASARKATSVTIRLCLS